MKILGAGLPRTGTLTLCTALRVLGYNAIHHAPERLPIYPIPDSPDWWRRYDDVDAVTDAPACYWYPEILTAYPDAVAILTVRDEQTWWESAQRHGHIIDTTAPAEHIWYTHALHAMIFGGPRPREYLWKRRFREHNAAVQDWCESHNRRLLVLNIPGGDGWDKLCSFLGLPVPDVPWPWEHKSQRNEQASHDVFVP